MGIFSGCILASDYDGTLADSNGQISDEVRKALKYFTENGGLFTVCTGRTKQGFHAFDSELMNAPILLANGSMAYDYKNGKTVFADCIEKDGEPEIRYIKDNYPDLGIEMYGADFKSYVFNPKPRNVSHFEFQFIDFEVVEDIPESLFPAVKVMILVGEDRCIDFQKFLDSAPLDKIKYIPQYGDFIEFVSKTSDKGRGLLKLAEAYGIDKSRVFSIGDGANDVTMLKAAAVGFVPENGCDLAKAAGNIIVKSNDESAVADAIYRIEKIISEENNESN